MRDYAKISTTIWRSEKFTNLPTDEDRLFYFYLHTCPHVNSIGCYVLPIGYITADLGWSEERVRNGIETLSKGLLIRYGYRFSVVKIDHFLTYDPFANPNHAKGAVKIALALPDCYEKLLILKEISELKYVDAKPFANRIETLSKRFRNGSLPEPEPEPEPDNIPVGANPVNGASPTVWDVWLSIVGNSNQNRSYLGKQIKQFGEAKVAQAVSTLSVRQPRPADPKQFLVGLLRESDSIGKSSTRKRSLSEDLHDTTWAQ